MDVLIWDFDGTLGYREGGAWTATLYEVLLREIPDSRVTLEDLRPYTKSGYPWSEPEKAHTHLDTPDKWWDALKPLFVMAYTGVGLDTVTAQRLAGLFRETYLTPERWRIFDDVLPTLRTLADQDWTHVLLSNHVPELDSILDAVALTPYFTQVFNSAVLGYEKPHPYTFDYVLKNLGKAVDKVWMIGDNPHADVEGAEKAGIPAILVRRFTPSVRYYAETLADVEPILKGDLNG